MNANGFILFMILMSCCAFPHFAFPEDTKINLPEAEVTATFEEQDFVGPLFTETNTKTKLTEKGINALGPFSKMSPQKTISLMPSVNQQSVDPIGLADISNYHESFRFRGVEPTAGGNPATPVNVESIPLTGRPGGGPAIYDMENFETISIYKGGVPADQAFGLTNIGGKIDMNIKNPAEVFCANMKQTLGSDKFRRSFLRLDTGILPLETAGFLSYSNTEGDKWKGEGNSTRNNAMISLTTQPNQGFKIGVYSIYSKSQVNTYRPLDYAKASSLDQYLDFDYSGNKMDYYYYGYNESKFEDHAFLGSIEYEFSNDSRVTLKPFYWRDNGYYSETITMKNGNNRIRRWDIDHELDGILTQYGLTFRNLDLNIGYFYLEQERPGPPTSWKLYKLSSFGLVFDKWQILSNSSKHRQSLPFVSGKYTYGPVTIEGGIKYLDYTMPSITTYDATNIPDIGYEKALDMATSVEADASARAKHFYEALPNFGLSYMFTEALSGYFSYGRNYGMSVALYPYFISQKSAFYSKGITLQDLWDKQKLELVDNFDVGLRYITETLYLAPTLYYARHNNKLAVYYDNALEVSFPANNADAEAYGFELEVGALPIDKLSLYASFSYNKFYFSQNLSDSSGSAISVDGNQVPDAPEFLIKGIASYRVGDLTLSPAIKYMSKRYGDILHEEKIDEATIFDLNITYTKAFPKYNIKKVDFSLSLNNIFNKKYIGIINTSDYQTLGSSYQAGAPMTAYATVSVSL